VRVHSFTLFYISRNMRCDPRPFLLARNLASLCLGRKPKARVVTSFSSHSFVLMLQLSQTHDNEELNSSSSCFFCSSAINPRDMTIRNLVLRRHVLFLFKCWRSPWARRRGALSSTQQRRVELLIVMYLFCSSVGSPHGHNDEEFSSSSLCSFVLMLQIN